MAGSWRSEPIPSLDHNDGFFHILIERHSLAHRGRIVLRNARRLDDGSVADARPKLVRDREGSGEQRRADGRPHDDADTRPSLDQRFNDLNLAGRMTEPVPGYEEDDRQRRLLYRTMIDP